MRPVLAVLSHRACGGRGRDIYRVGAAIELIHNFTLIHDDLPCMDDDVVRRGEATVHVVFGEAVALLAGDALLSLAFELLASLGGTRGDMALKANKVVREVAAAAGTMGIVGGQVLDIESEGRRVSLRTMDYIGTHKTGMLFSCSARVGGMLAGAPAGRLGALTEYGEKIGFAFQIVDDVRDLVAAPEELGKSKARDRVREKATYPLAAGIERSLFKARSLAEEAKRCVSGFGSHERYFVALADLILDRAVRHVR
ncbi:MAG: polyprenyl synthetase family protein [Candidatus Eisenbacteria bacterium]